jgi:hypothetical protein
LIGDLAYFSKTTRTSDAVALTEVELIRIPYETIQTQFESTPTWVQTMTKKLAEQVQTYSREIRSLKDEEQGKIISRLAVARTWSTLTFVSMQLGVREGDTVTIDWPTLRTYANLAFRQVSEYVLWMTETLETFNFCKIQRDKLGPASVTFTDTQFMTDFLQFYMRALTKNSPELLRIEKVEYDTLQALANPKLKITPIHRGQVEIDLAQFCELAHETGNPEVKAHSVDLLSAYGIEVKRSVTDHGVRLRFQHQEVLNLAKCWKILMAIHKLNASKIIVR